MNKINKLLIIDKMKRNKEILKLNKITVDYQMNKKKLDKMNSKDENKKLLNLSISKMIQW